MTGAGTGTTLVDQLGGLAAHTRLEDLPSNVASSVPQRVLDILGICVRSNSLDTSRGVIEFAADQGGRASATAIGVPERLPAPLAVLTARARGGRGNRGRGLAIASDIAERHGGSVATAPASRGARLVLELPAWRAGTAAAGSDAP